MNRLACVAVLVAITLAASACSNGHRLSAHVQKQIADKLGPIYTQVMQRRGANMMVEIGQTLASGASLDVTNDVLTALNSALPSVATTAPAQATRPQTQPQGR
jgi:uncharacterized membrane protein affecting hemolysin expression